MRCFVCLEARPGEEKELAQFFIGLDLTHRKEGTTPVSFALQLDPFTLGIFDDFTDEAAIRLT